MAFGRFVWSTLALGAIVLGCSSSGAAPQAGSCLDDPTACPAGQTCWPVSATPTFACIASASKGAFGVACENSIGAATCGDGLACDAVQGAASTRCTYYCDIAKGKGCPPNYDCVSTQTGGASGPMIPICRANAGHGSPPPTVDAGGSDAPFIEDAALPDATVDSSPANQ